MSTKTKRTVTATTSSTTQKTTTTKAGTPSQTAQTSGQKQEQQQSGEKSPFLSPTRFSRLHEKEELANLNDRLACYIERVRNLETENSMLTREVRTSQETINREVTSVKSLYENELSEARKLLDELSREKAKLEIDTKRLLEQNGELKNNLDKKTKECNQLQTSFSVSESKLNDLTGKYNQAQQERKKLADEKKVLEKEKNKLAAQNADLKKQTEEETLSRIEMENNLQSLREELEFKEQVHQKQLTEYRTKKMVEISELDGRLSQKYEEKLYQSLQEIRDQYELDLENNKDEMKKLYEEKVKSLGSQLTRNTTAATLAIEEMRQTQLRLDDLNKKLSDLETEKNISNQRARDAEKQYESAKAQYMEEFRKYDTEITRLRDEMSRRVQEYQDLMDIKVALDMEIAAYRKLLEGEEARLNITPVKTPVRQTPRKGARTGKRKRELFEEVQESSSSDIVITSSSKGDVEVMEVCPEGNFVKLHNKGNKEVAMGGWQVVRKAGENTTFYKLHRSVKLDAGATMTIWSANIPNQNHEPPLNLIMKGQKWMVSDDMTTTLVNNSGEEVAERAHKRQRVSSTISRQRDTGGLLQTSRSGPQVRQSERRVGEERCSIM